MITLHAYGELEIHSTVAQNHFESIVNGQIVIPSRSQR